MAIDHDKIMSLQIKDQEFSYGKGTEEIEEPGEEDGS